MNPETLLAWKSLYFSVFLTSSICGAITTLVVAWQIIRGDWRPASAGLIGRILILPKIWLRWRILYFTGLPTILAITALYVAHLGLDVIGNV